MKKLISNSLWPLRLQTVGTLLICLLLSFQTVAGPGDARFVFTGGPTAAGIGNLRQITLTVEWTVNGGPITSSPVVVSLAAGDPIDTIRNKAMRALKADPAIGAAFTMTPTSLSIPIIGDFESVALKHNKGVYACSAAIMNGAKSGTPPTLTNTVTGVTMSAGVDPTYGTISFQVQGAPTSGEVAFAVNGTVITIPSKGASISSIKNSLVERLREARLKVTLNSTQEVIVEDVVVDNLYQLGSDKTEGMSAIHGGASFYSTDPGIGLSARASQTCQISEDNPHAGGIFLQTKIFYLLVVGVVLVALLLFTALRLRARK
jgi:hypothetical protein